MASSFSHQSTEVGAAFRMQHPSHGWVGLEPFRQYQRVGIELWNPLEHIPAGNLQGDGIGIAKRGDG